MVTKVKRVGGTVTYPSGSSVAEGGVLCSIELIEPGPCYQLRQARLIKPVPLFTMLIALPIVFLLQPPLRSPASRPPSTLSSYSKQTSPEDDHNARISLQGEKACRQCVQVYYSAHRQLPRTNPLVAWPSHSTPNSSHSTTSLEPISPQGFEETMDLRRSTSPQTRLALSCSWNSGRDSPCSTTGLVRWT